MSTRPVIVTLGLTVVAGSFILAGCEDPDAQARQEAHDRVVAASLEYSKALQQTDPTQALQAIAATADQATSETAAAILHAIIKRDTASLMLRDAGALEAANRAARNDIQASGNAIARLSILVQHHQGFGPNIDRSALDEYRATAQQQLQEVSHELGQLEGPINELKVQNDRDRQEIDRLRAQANQLRERAFELGNLEGFQPIQEAVEIDRQADALEADTREREIELLTLQSQLEVAQLRQVQYEAQLEAVRETEAELAAAQTHHTQTAGTFGGSAEQLRSEAQRTLNEIGARQGELNSLYDNIDSTLSDGAARAGAGGPAGQTLRARLLQLEGQAHGMKARGLAEQTIILSLEGISPDARRQLNEARQQMDAATNARTEAYTSAADALPASSGGAAAFKTLLTAAAAGQTVELPADSGTSARGFASHEELVDFLIRNKGTENAVLTLLSTAKARTPEGRELLAVLTRFANASRSLDDAMRSAFPQAPPDAGGVTQMLDLMYPDLSAKKIIRESGDQVVYEMPTPLGPDEFAVVKVDGMWYVDADDIDASDTEAIAGLRQAATFFEDLAGKIRSGEISTEQQLQAAMEAAWQSMMSEGAGGFGGGD